MMKANSEVPLKVIGCVMRGTHKDSDSDSICPSCGYIFTHGQANAAKDRVVSLTMNDLVQMFGEQETVTLIKRWLNR